MNVRKRSGKVVPFDAGFIARAISLASAAAGEHDEQRGAAQGDDRHRADGEVQAGPARRGQGPDGVRRGRGLRRRGGLRDGKGGSET